MSDLNPLMDALPGTRDHELLYRNDRTVVARCILSSTGEALVCKQALGTLAIRRLRNERAVLERLAHLTGVARLAAVPTGSDMLVLHDDGGAPLGRSLAAGPLPVADTLRVAQQLAAVLAEVHRAGIVHRDVNPSNVLLSGPERRAVLIDFNIASGTGEQATQLTPHQGRIEGTLAYMAPEQTGRTGRPVDGRSDLYAVGVVIYEMLVGHPPFQGDDLLAMVHAHLTRIPPAPVALRTGVPPMLSAIVMRLLEKEPDRRYQSAEGLAHDLGRVQRSLEAGEATAFDLGEQDFAWRLLPPSRPIGRDDDIRHLHAALASAIDSAGTCIRIEGVAGEGKTALANELRLEVNSRRGWFIATRFDATRDDNPKAPVQVLKGIGALLLSQPETDLARQRERLATALGANLGVAAQAAPELAALLGLDPSEPLGIPTQERDKRLLQAAVDMLCAVARPERPLVLVLDDLQWACSDTFDFAQAMGHAATRTSGMLAVALHRPVGDGPLEALAASWAAESPIPAIVLRPLGVEQVAELAGHMLRLPAGDAGVRDLAASLIGRTGGNPQDTIELINALRHDGVLQRAESGWRWDLTQVRRHVAQNSRSDLLARRLAALPQACRHLLEALADLGAAASSLLLAAATDLAEHETLHLLASAVDDGLLEAHPRSDATDYHFRNASVLQAVRAGLLTEDAAERHLVLARRLGAGARYRHEAAQQYLLAEPAVQDDAERRSAADLLEHGAYTLGNLHPVQADQMLAAALRLLGPVEQAHDAPQMLRLLKARFSALSSLDRYDEADQVYAALRHRCTDPYDIAQAVGVRLATLTQRGHAKEALALGLETFPLLGITVPETFAAAIPAGLARLVAWIESDKLAEDLQRPLISEPHCVAQVSLLSRTMMPAFHADKEAYAWLTLECQRLWAEHGPSPLLTSGLSSASSLLISTMRHYRAAHTLARHLVKIGEARDFGSRNALPRMLLGSWASHWFEPLEQALAETRRGRDEMVAGGEENYASFAYSITSMQVFDTAPTLDDTDDEAETVLGRNRDMRGNINDSVTVLFRQLVRSLRGDTQGGRGSFNDASFDEVESLRNGAIASTAADTFRVLRTLSALLYNDYAATDQLLDRKKIFHDPGFYAGSIAHVFLAMSAAERLRNAGDAPDEADRALLTRIHQWLVQRAADAPFNYLHLLRLVEAEQAWVLGDHWRAGRAYEEAMREAEAHQRPWHRAWIFERAGRFWLSQQLHRSARPLLAEALRCYDAWGARGKVLALQEEFPFLRNDMARQRAASTQSTVVAGDMVDMMAILQASQALSSETSLVRLNQRVAHIIGAMAGAPSVLVAVRPEATAGWFLASSMGPGEQPVAVEAAAQQGRLVHSAFSYVQRTREPLLLEDAKADDRFARDPALADAHHCALLYVPLLSQGDLHAMLLLENRQRPGAFTGDRLDTLSLVAGQLSVSLNNALLYASLERKVTERTAALEAANRQLELLSVTDALTGLANRRRFNDAFDTEWARAHRNGSPVALALIDIDQFKQYNDHYGHQEGDACLQLVANAMASVMRQDIDLLARYGGEEFVLLMPDTDLKGALAAAERVRTAVQACGAAHAKSTHGVVTISTGVVSARTPEVAKASELLELADAALYDAKRNGRNRVEHAPLGRTVAA